jgi:uncharacterized paraquat-inducible protein A
MSSFIHLLCPGCGARIKAPFQLIGLTRSCPRCQHQLNIEIAAPQDSGPLLAADDVKRPMKRRFSDVY